MPMSKDNYFCCLFLIANTAIFLISLHLLPPFVSGEEFNPKLPSPSSPENEVAKKQLVLGSKPPTCVNKCMRCKPCLATLVIPSHNHIKGSHDEDDSYYLLSWKCRCGNKLYQP